MEDPKVPKKRGRKPKDRSTAEHVDEDADEESSVRSDSARIESEEEPRKRKRGRKPKCEIKSIQDIRQKFNNSDDKVIFQGSNEPIETDLVQVQVPFGNLNILVHSAKPVDKDELRNMFSKQNTEKPVYNVSTGVDRTALRASSTEGRSIAEKTAETPGVKFAAVENKSTDASRRRRAFGNGSESESESDSRYFRGSSHRTTQSVASTVANEVCDRTPFGRTTQSVASTVANEVCARTTFGRARTEFAPFGPSLLSSGVNDKVVSTPANHRAQSVGVNDKAVSTGMPDVEIVQKNKVKINRLLYKFVNKLEETKEWPTKCNTLCWWCCHSFESIPIPCVSKYDSIRKRFKIYGIFCSWNCAAAHAMKENDSILNLQLLKREWTGDASNIERSPSRYILKAFGGHMSLEEYRNNNGVQRSFHITKNNMDFINHNCIETYTETSKKVKSKYKLKRKNDNNISAPLFDTASPYPLTDGHTSGLDEY